MNVFFTLSYLIFWCLGVGDVHRQSRHLARDLIRVVYKKSALVWPASEGYLSITYMHDIYIYSASSLARSGSELINRLLSPVLAPLSHPHLLTQTTLR